MKQFFLINFINYSSVLFFLSSFSFYFTTQHSINNFNSGRHRRQITIVTESEFQCETDEYIDKSLVCDGIKDCLDGSDETLKQCGNLTCPSYVYRCNYGACIEQRAKCNGRFDCADQSDELPFVCDFQIPEQVHVCKSYQYQCYSEQCIDIKFLCDGKKDCNDGSDEIFSRCYNTTCDDKKFFRCDYGACVDKSYQCDGIRQCVDGSDESTRMCKISNETTEHVFPINYPNQKKCKKLTPINVDLKCYYNGSLVRCDSDLSVGTKVRPICKPFHTYKDFVPIYQKIICQEDGTWNYKLFSCIHECGRPYKIINTTSTTNETHSEHLRVESPWHVAIYNKDKILICGGTIISPYLILTAAHCFDGQTNNGYEIIVNTATKNYSLVENGSQKILKVKEIRYPDTGYFGTINYYVSDVAVLILTEKIFIELTVQPACVDWIHMSKYQPPEGTPGKLLGWDSDDKVNRTENLQIRFLSFISRDRCLRRVPNDFKPYVTSDKFCAGSDLDFQVIPRSPGSGLLIREGSRYYIRGILSSKPSTNKYVATFTDLAPYIGWILNVRNEVDQQMND